MAGNRDERKSGHMGAVSGAYGNTGQSLLNRDVTQPFNQPGFAGGRGGGGGAGGSVPIPNQGAPGTLQSANYPTESLMGGPPNLGGAYAPSAAGSVLSSLSEWLNPRTLAALGLTGAGAINSLRQPSGMEGLEELFGLSMDRARASEPLFQQLLKMTTAQMPDYTREGGQ